MLENKDVLIASVRSLINEETESFWKDSEILDWLNEGQTKMCSETGLLSSYYTRTLQAGDIVNTREVRVYSDFIALDEGGVYYDGKPLTYVSSRALNEWTPNWKDSSGTPEMYSLRGDMLVFNPAPAVGGIVSYYGIERADVMVDDETPFAGDYRTVPFRIYIRDYAIAQCWYKKKEMADYEKKMFMFEYGMTKVNSILNRHKAETHRMIPEYQQRGSAYSIQYGMTDTLD